MSDAAHMMTCRELVELVTDYVEGRMEAPVRERFEEHLDACPACRIYLEQMRATIATLGRIPPESLSSRAEEELLAAFRDWAARR
jgi:anti-sigma factor RsiW